MGDVVKEGEAIECRVLAIDPDEQRMSLSVKELLKAPAVSDDAPSADSPEAEDEPPAAVVKRRFKPLKGGLGGPSAGEKFGLKW
ncbi:MAG: hypothetical protein ACKOTB_00165 [Planctomycetia bacterium]